jgi:hypothetical protein
VGRRRLFLCFSRFCARSLQHDANRS